MIAHLGGGANIVGMRLHNALRRTGLDSYFYYGAGEPPISSFVSIIPESLLFLA